MSVFRFAMSFASFSSSEVCEPVPGQAQLASWSLLRALHEGMYERDALTRAIA
jgi:hypothetical protein